MRSKIYTGLSIALLVLVFGCQKNDTKIINVEEEDFKNNYFSLENGIFKNDTFPQSTASDVDILSITGYEIISVSRDFVLDIEMSSENFNYILTGIKDVKGYMKKEILLTPDSTTFPLLIDIGTYFTMDTTTFLFAVEDNMGQVNQLYTIDFYLVQGGPGELHVTCSWDKNCDIDLHLIEPQGEEIYYGNTKSEYGGRLNMDSNTGCNTNDYRQENIYYYDSIMAGEYTVNIDLYSSCFIEDTINYTVTAWLNGHQLTPETGTSPYYGYFLPEDEDYGEELSGQTVMTFNIDPESININYGNRFNKFYRIDYHLPKDKNFINPMKLKK